MITIKPEVREMTVVDIDQVYAIETSAHATPWSRLTFQREIANKRHNMCLVAELGESVVGFMCMYHVLDEGHVTNIAVAAPYQNKGIATYLMLEAVERVIKRGIKRLTLEVRKSNTKAQHLYIKFGFKMSGLRKAYYTDNREDALVFWTGDISDENYQQLFKEIRQSLDDRE
ncbi:MAG: ribosomal protein S18-alanine N-acetyltransferase [Actinomycetota bacterium]|nr:ribosomal protein S18-alanine N-acetyltransferase [Actinomycetota bacterium]